jgi:4-amino-4-deoxy-L-arabinose transferase-like glycosyltransferase
MNPVLFLKRPRVLLLFITAACLLPFLNKAFHIDDTLFIRAAQQIQKHPLDFYGFNINWFGYTSTMVQAFENPPLTSYFIAIAASVVGWSEPALHFVFLLPALAVAWGTFTLAQQYCRRPLLAGLVAVLSPVFLISATTVMCDVMLAALWVWTVVLFEKGAQNNNRTAYVLSGCLGGLAILTKFPGLSLVPLLAAYGICRFRRPGWWIVAAVLPLLFAAGYELLTWKIYGKGLLFFAAAYASDFRAIGYDKLWEKMVIAVGFVGGCFLPALFFSPWLWSRRLLLAGPCLLAACMILFPQITMFVHWIWKPDQGLDWRFFLQGACYFVAGLHIFLLAIADVWRRRDPVSILLLLWVFGLFFFTSAVNWTINGRSLLSAIPAIGILVARRYDLHSPSTGSEVSFKTLWPAIPAAALALLFVKADYDFANAHRDAANLLGPKYQKAGRTVWFQGHWGLQYYFEKYDAKASETKSPKYAVGDILVFPFDTSPLYGKSPGPFKLLETVNYPMPTHCATMSYHAGAGFYASVFGPLPFAIGAVRPECFIVYEIEKPFAPGFAPPGDPSQVTLDPHR